MQSRRRRLHQLPGRRHGLRRVGRGAARVPGARSRRGRQPDATPALASWTIDLTAPATTITSSPPPFTAATDASFAFSAVDVGGSTVAAYECRVDDDAFAPCTSPADFSGLALGEHTFEVRATDAVGNIEATPASVSWTVSNFFAAADDVSGLEDTSSTVDVLGNDVTPQGAPVTVALAAPQSTRGGTLTVNESGEVIYAPPAELQRARLVRLHRQVRGRDDRPRDGDGPRHGRQRRAVVPRGWDRRDHRAGRLPAGLGLGSPSGTGRRDQPGAPLRAGWPVRARALRIWSADLPDRRPVLHARARGPRHRGRPGPPRRRRRHGQRRSRHLHGATHDHDRQRRRPAEHRAASPSPLRRRPRDALAAAG